MASSSTLFQLGSYVWVPNEKECFNPGRVMKAFKKGEEGLVSVNDEEVSIPATTKDLLRMDEESLNSIENMVKLRSLNEASILHNLRLRFSQDLIYTSVGNILVSVNPFKLLPIYTPEILDKYRKDSTRDLPPHVYAVADRTYLSMMSDNKSQSCIVSGESGAGKTEATKLLLQYITEVSGGVKSKKDLKKGMDASLQEQILKANPLMEAFGNAKTVRNNNSSRFGKWIQVKFDAKGTIVGGAITNYLLEKSRIVKQTEGERNYHIFYQLCVGAKMDSTLKNRLKIRDPDEYHYLSQSGTINVDSINDERDWEDTNTAMSVLKMSPEEKEDVLRSLAGLLHLGNITFKECVDAKTKEDASEIENPELLELAAEQLGVSSEALGRSMTTRNIGTRSVIFVSYNATEANDARDALAKTLYGHLFDWLIRKINESLSSNLSKDGNDNCVNSIGVLDIFGFESFITNSFEQLCINYCNEKLQFHFNEQIFKLEQHELKEEGVDCSSIDYVDNQPCLLLIEERGKGLLSMLDEEIQVPKGSDTGFLNKAISRHGTHVNFKRTNPKEKDSRNCFTVIHYAGPVHYNVNGFLVKNKDELHIDLQTIMNASKHKFIRRLFELEAANRAKRSSQRGVAKRKTLGTQFKEQLHTLMVTLNDTNPHFIRCIKPNSEKIGDSFDAPMVMSQLKYAGLLEVCRIRQTGYPIRKDFADFEYRYLPLVPSAKGALVLCDKLIQDGFVAKDGLKVGKTKVFLRNNAFDKLENQREIALRSVASVLQRTIRGYVCRVHYNTCKTILRDLNQHVKDRNTDGITKQLKDCSELPHGGQHLDSVIAAKDLLYKLEREDNVIELLDEAIKSRDYNSLLNAIAAAKEIEYTGEEYVKAAETMDGLAEEKNIRTALSDAVKSGDFDSLSDSIAKAEGCGLDTVEEYRQALALKTRMEQEKEIGSELEAVLESRDLKQLVQVMENITSLGLEVGDLFDRAQSLRDELQKEEEVKGSIKNALQQGNVQSLQKSLNKAISLFGENHELVMSGTEQLKQLEQKQQIEFDIRGNIATGDVEKLHELLNDAASAGFDKNNSSVVKEAKAFISRMEAIDYCKEQLAEALQSNEINSLSAAVAKMADLGITNTPEYNEAQTTLKKLGTRADMSSQISTAIASVDIDLLQELLVKAEAIQGMENDIQNAKLALGRFQDEKIALASLHEALDNCEVTSLENSIENVGKFPALVAKNEIELDRARAALECCKSIESLLENGSIDDLEDVQQNAVSLGLKSVGVVEKANDRLQNLKLAADLADRLKPLLASKDKEGVIKLLDLVPKDLPPNDIIREAQIMVHREKMIIETNKMLEVSEKERDLDLLNSALQKVFELGLVSKEVEQAKKLHIELSEQRANCAEVVAQVKTLETKAKSKFGIQKKDVDALVEAIQNALDKGLDASIKELTKAAEVKIVMERQLEIQDELKVALLKGEFEQLKAAMEHAQELDVNLEIAEKVRNAVRKKDVERRAAQREAFDRGEELPVDMENEEVDENELRQKRESKIKKAIHDRYRFTKYHKLRSPDDFVRGIFFHKKRIGEHMLQYQHSVIPRSLIELDKDLSKVAIRLHKSLLGYCGDKSMSFPETLAQDILTKALENPELIDEVYVQLCKHLTQNPKPESIGRCWQLMCMAVGTFPPSSDFELYLINFIAGKRFVPGLIGNYARYALRRVEGIINSGASGFVPSVDEIQSYKERPPILASIQLVDGTLLTEDLPVTPDLDVGKILDICLHFLDMEDERRDTFGVFVNDVTGTPLIAGPGESSKIASEIEISPRPLRSQDFLGDVIVQATRQKRETKFVFKQKIHIREDNEPSEDPIYNRLVYLQALDDVITGRIALAPENMVQDEDSEVKRDDVDELQIILELAVISITVDTEEYPDSMEKLTEVDILDYIPMNKRVEKSDQEWKELIVAQSANMTVDTSEGFQELYVNICKRSTLYGSCQFFIRKVNELPNIQNLPRDMILCFNSEGMHFLDVETKLVLLSFGYADMYRWGGSSTQFSVIIWDDETQDTFELSVYTTQAGDMAGLILDYINAIMERVQ